ncbi:MAG: hypothetical protein ABWY00_01270 [Dongiaceae bacterium]
MPQLRRQAAKWWLSPPPQPLPDLGLKTRWSVFLAAVLGAAFAVSLLIKGYTYLGDIISPPPPSPAEQINRFESDLKIGRQQLKILSKEVAEATTRLEKLQAGLNDPEATSTEKEVAEAKQDLEEKAQVKNSIQRAVDQKKARLDALRQLPPVGTMLPK